MDKRILDVVQNISLWSGDVYKLAAAVAAEQREICEEEYAAQQVVTDDPAQQ
jgi:hypothetical protein